MSTDIENKPKEKTEEQLWWCACRRPEIYKEISSGTTIEETAKKMDIGIEVVERAISNEYFSKRMQLHLSIGLYDMQLRKLAYMPVAFEKLKAEFEKRIANTKDDIVVNNFIKLLLLKVDKTNLTPNMVNILIDNTMKKGKKLVDKKFVKVDNEDEISVSEEEEAELREKFGYKDPGIINNESTTPTTEKRLQNTEMDRRSETEEQQGS